mmetsp:Transcript_6156/g.8691  ORF Transcript_6156/g.8691 Transcript_6156/m.8691 type:complete len:134 (-) Transcript_6156:260-661(-)
MRAEALHTLPTSPRLGNPPVFFFLERKDAERILKTVQKEDPKAKVTTIPFTEAVAFVENKGVNFGGEFHVLPSPREIANANNVRLLGHDQAFLKLGKKTPIEGRLRHGSMFLRREAGQRYRRKTYSFSFSEIR